MDGTITHHNVLLVQCERSFSTV